MLPGVPSGSLEAAGDSQVGPRLLGPWEGSDPILSAAERVARETQKRRSELLSMRGAAAGPGGFASQPGEAAFATREDDELCASLAQEAARRASAPAEGPPQSSVSLGAPPSSQAVSTEGRLPGTSNPHGSRGTPSAPLTPQTLGPAPAVGERGSRPDGRGTPSSAPAQRALPCRPRERHVVVLSPRVESARGDPEEPQPEQGASERSTSQELFFDEAALAAGARTLAERAAAFVQRSPLVVAAVLVVVGAIVALCSAHSTFGGMADSPARPRPEDASAAPRLLERGEIQWGGSPGKCVVAEDEPAKAGSSLVVVPCPDRPFGWTAPTNKEKPFLRPVPYPELCMDNPKGSVLQLWPCSEFDAVENMKFELHAAGTDATRGTIRPARDTSLCVSVPADGQPARLEVLPCALDSPSSIFMFVGASDPAPDPGLVAEPAGMPAVAGGLAAEPVGPAAVAGGSDAAPLAARDGAGAVGLGPDVGTGQAGTGADLERIRRVAKAVKAKAAESVAAEQAAAGTAQQARSTPVAAEDQDQETAKWLQEAAVARLRRRQRSAQAAVAAQQQPPDEAAGTGLAASGGAPAAPGPRETAAPVHETDAEKARREAHAEAELLGTVG